MIKSLHPTHNTISPKKLFGLDIETYGEDNKFVMGSIVGNDFKKVFWNQREMIDFIFNSHVIRNSIIFATNLGFDFFALFDEFEKYSKFDMKMRGDRFILIELSTTKSHTHRYHDTINYLMASVEKLGEIMKIPKLPKPKCITPHGARFPENDEEKTELEIYNLRDSEITYLFADFLQTSFNTIGTNLYPTIASTSMSLFRNKYLDTIVYQPIREILEIMFNCYYGGRTEAFYRGKIINKVNYYDVNSLYPHVMKSRHYPQTNSLKYTDNPTIDIIEHEGFSQCGIITPDLKYPLLPHRINGKLCFPLGNWIGWYCHNELRKAKELGYIIIPIQSYYCTEVFNPFVRFVDDLYEKRQYYKSINSPLELIYKILLNSLYGKFAQKLEHGEILFIKNQKDKERLDTLIDHNAISAIQNKEQRFKIYSPMQKLKEIEGKKYDISTIFYVTDTENVEYASFINPLISAYITAWARLELYTHIEYIEQNNGTLYYCDTDSLMTDLELPVSKELGALKKEIVSNDGIIVKPKVYYLKSNEKADSGQHPFAKGEYKEFIKFKGLSNLKDYMSFNKVLDSQKYQYMKFSKFRESLRRNISFNSILQIEKLLDLEDNKRGWNGKEFNKEVWQRSEPLYYSENIMAMMRFKP